MYLDHDNVWKNVLIKSIIIVNGIHYGSSVLHVLEKQFAALNSTSVTCSESHEVQL